MRVPRTFLGTRMGWYMNNEIEFFRTHLISQVLPFWEKAFDEEYGGVYTCFSNDGKTLLSKDKYTWSQARMLWCLSYLLKSPVCRSGLDKDRLDRYQHAANKLYSFLDEHAFLSAENEVAAFLLDRFGQAKESMPGKGYYTSFYADCFLVMAYARYSLLVKDAAIARKALAVYQKMRRVLSKGIVKTEPYPLPEGASAHSVPMILSNTAKELSVALKEFLPDEAVSVGSEAESFALATLNQFVDQETMQVREVMLPEKQETSLLERHRNPGHAVESMWFCMDVLEPRYYAQIGNVVQTALTMGWDTEYGGLLRYVDQDGGAVAGNLDGSSFAQLVADTWEYKLWWPHCEALYACLRLYQATRDESFFAWYQRIKAYTFSTFPGQPGKEWIQIRNRNGTPQERVVALPVKDPYHIIRMLLLVIEALDADEKETQHGV